MRLRSGGYDRPLIPVIPMGSLALLVLSTVAITAMYSSAQGPGLRFASADRDGRVREADAIRVEVLSDHEASVNGEPVSTAELAESVAGHLANRSDATVVLAVAPEATYETMVVAYAAIAGLPGPPRIAFPARPTEGR